MNENNHYFDVNNLDSVSFEDYWSLDIYGRCIGAVACLGCELMPSEKRGSISEVKPSGWQSTQKTNHSTYTIPTLLVLQMEFHPQYISQFHPETSHNVNYERQYKKSDYRTYKFNV